MSTSEYSPLGERIRSRRKQLGLTQEELAEQSNLSVNYISKIERTQGQNISFEVLTNIAKSLNISIADLLGNYPITPSAEDVKTTQEKRLLNKLRQMDKSTQNKAINAILQLLELRSIPGYAMNDEAGQVSISQKSQKLLQKSRRRFHVNGEDKSL
ncbi:helix-turn-helix domain-containing protein [Levilactobacillus andaensis]|uniref:helix-turn-helix domain-containing protein n=1 Tax=Levilactobacillus andaensis TaxID=2799570 RepID=UPI0019426092|nr:helix-turn-helix transcriptional regulator [Levilactobacillus andaensis]